MNRQRVNEILNHRNLSEVFYNENYKKLII